MCAIAGLIQASGRPAAALVENLLLAQAHRGPDAAGLWVGAERFAFLGHRRLAIVDLSPTGAQPMVSPCGRWVLSLNGEIYNHRSLRAELKSGGARFRGSSDTEVLLRAIEVWGLAKTLPRLNGMFAFALWDTQRRELQLVRDRLGVKPLYYLQQQPSQQKARLIFSSELTPAFVREAEQKIDRLALAQFVRYGRTRAPRTIWEDIKCLLPGTYLKVKVEGDRLSALDCQTYWSAEEAAQAALSEGPLLGAPVDQLRKLLSRSVRERLDADVAVSCFLSSGIDSSLITALAAREARHPLKTFSIGFGEREWDESVEAEKIAQHLGTQHQTFQVTDRDALTLIPELPRIYGEPFADSSQIPMALLCRLTGAHTRVALSGDGGDELFGGYQIYRGLRALDALLPGRSILGEWGQSVLPSGEARRKLAAAMGAKRYGNLTQLFVSAARVPDPTKLYHRSEAERLVLGAKTFRESYASPIRFSGMLQRRMIEDTVDYLPNDVLTKVDRASMRYSLEVRAPFADDVDLFRFAWGLPDAFKISLRNFQGKRILRELLSELLPPSLVSQCKRGFCIPLAQWLKGPLRDWAGDALAPERLHREAYFDVGRVQNLRQSFMKGDSTSVDTLWSLCIFQEWLTWLNSDAYPKELGAEKNAAVQRAPEKSSNKSLEY